MLSLITHYRLCVLLLLNAVLPSREACHEAEQGKQADEGDHHLSCFSHLFVSLKCWLKKFAGGLMWIQRLVLHPSSDKAFSQILTQKIGQGPSMDSTLGTASRHHDKILQCDYFDAECHQRSLKRFEKVLHKKNKS